MRRSLPAPRATRRAFTLFEVLVALGLSLLLMSAVYAGLSLYWRYSSAGQVEVERAQLARALLRRIELDLRSVMYRPPPVASSSSGSNGGGSSGNSTGGTTGSGSSTGGNSSGSSSSGNSGDSSQTTTTTTTTTPDDAYGTSSTGLFGNSTTILMHVSKPGREQMAVVLAATGNTQTRISDLATVAYFAGGTSTGSLQQAITSPGLARLEGDRLALAMADQQSNVAAIAARTEILAPEVSAIRFAYYDGFRWRYDWDSKVLGGLPKAVDVELELRPAATSGRAAQAAIMGVTPTVYRLVVAIPLAKPIDSTTILP